MDVLHALAHPGGLLSKMRDARHVGEALVRQLRDEQLTNPALEPRIDAVERSVRERFAETTGPLVRQPGDPTLRMTFDTEHGRLSFLTVQGVFGIPQHITVGSVRSELWFPADDQTRSVIEAHVTRPPAAPRSAVLLCDDV